MSFSTPQQRQCWRCSFYARSPHLVCALHPAGPDYFPCPDFERSVKHDDLMDAIEDLWRMVLEPLRPGSLLEEEEAMEFWSPEDSPE